MQQSVLFRKTEEYHQNELKLLFEEHYRPVDSDEVNNKWVQVSRNQHYTNYVFIFLGQWGLTRLSGIVIMLEHKPLSHLGN